MNIYLEYLIQGVAAFFATVAFCILFNVPHKQYAVCGAIGGVSWLIYCLFDETLGVFVATFLATVAIVLISRVLAIFRKTPVTILLIPGMIPLVPGTAIYQTAYYCFTGDVALFAEKGFLTVKLAFAIVLGIVIVFALPIKKSGFGSKSIKIKKGDDKNG